MISPMATPSSGEARIMRPAPTLRGHAPSHVVVINVHVAQAAHHLELVHPVILAILLLDPAVGVGEAVCHLKGRPDVQTQQLAGDQVGEVLLAVLDDFQHHLRPGQGRYQEA